MYLSNNNYDEYIRLSPGTIFHTRVKNAFFRSDNITTLLLFKNILKHFTRLS